MANKGVSKTQQRQLFRQELKPEDARIRVCCRANCTRPHKALGMCHMHYKTIGVKVSVFLQSFVFFMIQIFAKSLCSLIWKEFAKIACCVTSTCMQPCLKQAKKMRSRGDFFVLYICTQFSLQQLQHLGAAQRTSGVLPSCRRRAVCTNRPRAVSIEGRQSLVAVDQQDQQREGYRIPYRQR
jgi:hypothetical protein